MRAKESVQDCTEEGHPMQGDTHTEDVARNVQKLHVEHGRKLSAKDGLEIATALACLKIFRTLLKRFPTSDGVIAMALADIKTYLVWLLRGASVPAEREVDEEEGQMEMKL